jgi:hypothetical protein
VLFVVAGSAPRAGVNAPITPASIHPAKTNPPHLEVFIVAARLPSVPNWQALCPRIQVSTPAPLVPDSPHPMTPLTTAREATRVRELYSRQSKSGIAARLGWFFDGLELDFTTLVALPLVM